MTFKGQVECPRPSRDVPRQVAPEGSCSGGPGDTGCPGLATTKGLLLAKGSHRHVYPPWKLCLQPPDPTPGPTHGLQGLEMVGKHQKHLLPISRKADLRDLEEEGPRKVQKIEPSLSWGGAAPHGMAEKLGTTGQVPCRCACSALWGWMRWCPWAQFPVFSEVGVRRQVGRYLSMLWCALHQPPLSPSARPLLFSASSSPRASNSQSTACIHLPSAYCMQCQEIASPKPGCG